MNTYGKTQCPKCGTPNSMFRPLEVCREMPAWDACKCFECGHEYKHSEQKNIESKEGSEYEIKWPNYCRKCYGNGGFIDYEYRGEFHGVPASEQIYNYCTQCIESNECPRCRSQENNFYSALDSDEVQLTCFSCGWKDGDPGIKK